MISKSNRLRLLFIEASRHKEYQNRWHSDDAWRKILQENHNAKAITKKEVNTPLPDAILDDELCLITNKRGINIDNKTVKVRFYFITSEETTKEQIKISRDKWKQIHDDFVIPRKKARVDVHIGSPCCVRLPSIAPRPSSRRNEDILAKIGGYWESANAKALFAPSSPDNVGTGVVLSSRVALLKDLLNDPEEIVNYVNKATEEGCELSVKDTGIVLHKITYLLQAYKFALLYMNGKTWEQCCEMAIKAMENVDVENGE